MVDELKQKERQLVELAEGVVNVNGNTVIAMMSLALKLEQTGVSEIHHALTLMLSDDDLEH